MRQSDGVIPVLDGGSRPAGKGHDGAGNKANDAHQETHVEDCK